MYGPCIAATHTPNDPLHDRKSGLARLVQVSFFGRRLLVVE